MTEPKRKRVLVVDDTGAVQVLIRRWITNEGYEIDLASNGREALERAATTPPDLILLDVMMPGINGYAVCRQLRENEQTKNTPVIIITALPTALDSEEGKLSGANEVMIKPLNPEELIRRVRAYLGSPFT
jgi:CheY-like chemotaxis protein